MIYYISYISTSLWYYSETELAEMKHDFGRRNGLVGISGAMLYQDGKILQLIEGNKAEVEHLFAKIEHDTRHDDIRQLLTGETEQRQFGRWSMAVRDLSLDKSEFSDTYRMFHYDSDASIGHKLLASFKEVLD